MHIYFPLPNPHELGEYSKHFTSHPVQTTSCQCQLGCQRSVVFAISETGVYTGTITNRFNIKSDHGLVFCRSDRKSWERSKGLRSILILNANQHRANASDSNTNQPPDTDRDWERETNEIDTFIRNLYKSFLHTVPRDRVVILRHPAINLTVRTLTYTDTLCNIQHKYITICICAHTTRIFVNGYLHYITW